MPGLIRHPSVNLKMDPGSAQHHLRAAARTG